MEEPRACRSSSLRRSLRRSRFIAISGLHVQSPRARRLAARDGGHSPGDRGDQRGIDLSVGSMIAVANVLSASLMQHASFRQSLALAVLVLVLGAAQGAINGVLIVVSRIPDIVVSLTTGFIWGGVALLILERPGGGAPSGFLDIGAGADLSPFLPNALILLIVAVGVIWLPVRSSRLGLSLYATGSDPMAAFRSGSTRVSRVFSPMGSAGFSARSAASRSP